MSSLRPPEYPRREPSFRFSSAQFAMYIGLAALSMVFAGTLVAYFITRAQATEWHPPEISHFPGGLWVSTALLVMLSAALHRGHRRLMHNDRKGLSNWLKGALLLGVVFLLAQVQNWRAMAMALDGVEVRSLYVFCFYLLTALHALHVFAGVLPLWHVHSRAARDEYSSSRDEGVKLLRQYWDFLLVVWFLLVAALFF